MKFKNNQLVTNIKKELLFQTTEVKKFFFISLSLVSLNENIVNRNKEMSMVETDVTT